MAWEVDQGFCGSWQTCSSLSLFRRYKPFCDMPCPLLQPIWPRGTNISHFFNDPSPSSPPNLVVSKFLKLCDWETNGCTPIHPAKIIRSGTKMSLLTPPLSSGLNLSVIYHKIHQPPICFMTEDAFSVVWYSQILIQSVSNSWKPNLLNPFIHAKTCAKLINPWLVKKAIFHLLQALILTLNEKNILVPTNIFS